MLVFNKYFYKKEEVKVVLWRPYRCPKRLHLPNRREYIYSISSQYVRACAVARVLPSSCSSRLFSVFTAYFHRGRRERTKQKSTAPDASDEPSQQKNCESSLRCSALLGRSRRQRSRAHPSQPAKQQQRSARHGSRHAAAGAMVGVPAAKIRVRGRACQRLLMAGAAQAQQVEEGGDTAATG
jgi:hypothetical protein